MGNLDNANEIVLVEDGSQMRAEEFSYNNF